MSKNRALLLDRDGVINADTNYVGSIERFAFLPDLFPFLRSVQDLGFRLAILTNQSGVARGLFSEKDHNLLTAHILKEFKAQHIEIDLTLACFEHEEGTLKEYARQSFWRKPNPGMILEAIRRLDLDPLRSAFLGDKVSDMIAAERGHIKTRLLLTTEKVVVPSGVMLVRNYGEALKALSA